MSTATIGGRNFVALLLSFLFMFFFSSSVLAATQEVEAIQQQIDNTGARWRAADTSITQLPVERRLKRVIQIRPVSVPQSAAHKSTPKATANTSSNATSSDSYLNYACTNSGYNFVTPVRDQGDCGSCWAFGTTAALESQQLMSAGGTLCGTPSTLDLSEEILLSCCGSNLCGSCNGGWIDTTSDFIMNTGLPAYSDFPYPNYTNAIQTSPACSQAQVDWWRNTDAVKNWEYVATTSPTVTGLKNALTSYGPLVTTMQVYNDFYSYAGGIYSYVGGRGDTYQGSHVVTIIGYDDAESCFIVKNSWGIGWGEPATEINSATPNNGGFFRIAYSQLGNPVQFGYYTIAYLGYKPITNTCSYSISPVSASVSYAGGDGTLKVTSGCSWTAVSNVDWISVVSGATGTGNGTVKYYVYPNNTSISWTGTLTVGEQTFTVTQAAR